MRMSFARFRSTPLGKRVRRMEGFRRWDGAIDRSNRRCRRADREEAVWYGRRRPACLDQPLMSRHHSDEMHLSSLLVSTADSVCCSTCTDGL
ncbi:hypothetical protein FIBSPDRAFT_103973 [Athelia psychrophila]|uniref:Uncharacterized protein n=1 Tax=Athelia psychrophila TaxID=1759441 RepID=A0A166DCT4_9AGAM|nr:hypothetical protein FIBSPDRAFT_103973 [Fibularhizoctonia sp. CBS 109695]